MTQQIDLRIDVIDRVDDPIGAFEPCFSLAFPPQPDSDVDPDGSSAM
jgi:hypothetical protein